MLVSLLQQQYRTLTQGKERINTAQEESAALTREHTNRAEGSLPTGRPGSLVLAVPGTAEDDN